MCVSSFVSNFSGWDLCETTQGGCARTSFQFSGGGLPPIGAAATAAAAHRRRFIFRWNIS